MSHVQSIDRLVAEAKAESHISLGHVSESYVIGHLAARLHFALEELERAKAELTRHEKFTRTQ